MFNRSKEYDEMLKRKRKQALDDYIFIWGAGAVETPVKRSNRLISENGSYGKPNDTIEHIDSMLAEIERDLENWMAESGEE